jgi:DNA-binding winged helix-turn-helix (wHTH) protein
MSGLNSDLDPTNARRSSSRILQIGLVAITAILAIAAVLLFMNLPSASAFQEQIAELFQNSNLTAVDPDGDESSMISQQRDNVLALLGLLSQSGERFSDVLVSYRIIIFVLIVFATALLVAALVFLITIMSLNRRIREIELAGIQVSSLVISREERKVYMNSLEFSLTEAGIETLAVLAEARMDDDVLSGAEIEAMISGKSAADCDEAAGATRIKRLRDTLGNQIVSELLIKNITRKGYMLSIDKKAIEMI